MTCALCEADNGTYSMNLQCCRVRYLLHEPRIDVRRAWLARWTARDGHEVGAALKAEFTRRWADKYKN